MLWKGVEVVVREDQKGVFWEADFAISFAVMSEGASVFGCWSCCDLCEEMLNGFVVVRGAVMAAHLSFLSAFDGCL